MSSLLQVNTDLIFQWLNFLSNENVFISRATGPILDHLREMELEDHPLRHEIIKCLPTGPPRFEVSKIPANSEIANDSVTNLDMSAMKQQIKEKHLKELDPSQKDAYLHALENKVAIIQGWVLKNFKIITLTLRVDSYL